MTYLVLGAGTLLGSNVVSAGCSRNEDVIGTYQGEEPDLDIDVRALDVRDHAAVTTLIDEISPRAVINCNELADLGKCETDPDRAREINADVPGRIAQSCAERDVDFVQCSTSYVFDGEAEAPYDETSTTGPIQTYGSTKRAGEQAVTDAHPNPLICRHSFLWGIHGGTNRLTGFPVRVRDRLARGVHVSLSSDRYVSPTRAGTAGSHILELLAMGEQGVYHLGSRTCTTPFSFGWEIGERLDPKTLDLIIQSPAKEIEYPASRPNYACLDVSKLEATLDSEMSTLEEELDALSTYLQPDRVPDDGE